MARYCPRLPVGPRGCRPVARANSGYQARHQDCRPRTRSAPLCFVCVRAGTGVAPTTNVLEAHVPPVPSAAAAADTRWPPSACRVGTCRGAAQPSRRGLCRRPGTRPHTESFTRVGGGEARSMASATSGTPRRWRRRGGRRGARGARRAARRARGPRSFFSVACAQVASPRAARKALSSRTDHCAGSEWCGCDMWELGLCAVAWLRRFPELGQQNTGAQCGGPARGGGVEAPIDAFGQHSRCQYANSLACDLSSSGG